MILARRCGASCTDRSYPVRHFGSALPCPFPCSVTVHRLDGREAGIRDAICYQEQTAMQSASTFPKFLAMGCTIVGSTDIGGKKVASCDGCPWEPNQGRRMRSL